MKIPKQIIIIVSSLHANNAARPVSIAMAANANAMVVAIAQNLWSGGIHVGTNPAVAEK